MNSFPWQLVGVLTFAMVACGWCAIWSVMNLELARKQNNDDRFRFFESVADWCALGAILSVMLLTIVLVKWLISLW